MENVEKLLRSEKERKAIKEINRNFRIKITIYEQKKRVDTRLVGVSGLVELLGYSAAMAVINTALGSRKQTPSYYTWRGLARVQFYRK